MITGDNGKLFNNYSSPARNQWFQGLFGLITCKLSLAIVFIPAVFSVWILDLVAIAIERFYAVTRPFRSSPLSQHLKKTIVINDKHTPDSISNNW